MKSNIYTEFDYDYYTGHYAFLKNFPKVLENGEMEPIKTVYKFISDNLDKDLGLFIYANTSLDTAALFVPVAVNKGITYQSILGLPHDVESPEFLSLCKNKELILDEVGQEHSRSSWVIDKIIDYRYLKGLKTYIGYSGKELASKRYSSWPKIKSMMCGLIKLNATDLIIKKSTEFISIEISDSSQNYKYP